MRYAVWFLVCGALALAGQHGAASGRLHGVWGGEHMGLTVTASGATTDFDCAHGMIDEPIVVGAGGSFDVGGVYIKDHGGPIRRGEREDGHPARYKGRVEKHTMTVTIELTDTREVIGPFTLTRGASPQVFKCV